MFVKYLSLETKHSAIRGTQKMAKQYIVIKNSNTGSTSVALPGDKRMDGKMWKVVSKHTSRKAAMEAMAKADPVKAKVDALLKRKRTANVPAHARDKSRRKYPELLVPRQEGKRVEDMQDRGMGAITPPPPAGPAHARKKSGSVSSPPPTTKRAAPPVRGLGVRRPVPSSPPPTTRKASAKIPAHAKMAAQRKQKAAASYSPTDFAIGGTGQPGNERWRRKPSDPTPRPRAKPMMPRGQDMAGMAPPDKVVPAGSPGKGKQAFMKREDKRASWKPPKQKDYTKGAVESLRKKASLDKAIKSAVAESKIDVPAGGRRKPGYTPDVALGKRRRKYEAADKRKRDFDYMEEEQGGQRKGGKITKKKATKKSSTSHRSRPKNPTLQKTSYNY